MKERNPYTFKLAHDDVTLRFLGIEVNEDVRCEVKWMPLWMDNRRLEPVRVDGNGKEYLEIEPEDRDNPWGIEVEVLTGDGTTEHPSDQHTYVLPVDTVLESIGDELFELIDLPPATRGDKCDLHGRHLRKNDTVDEEKVCSRCKERVLRILRTFQNPGEVVR